MDIGAVNLQELALAGKLEAKDLPCEGDFASLLDEEILTNLDEGFNLDLDLPEDEEGLESLYNLLQVMSLGLEPRVEEAMTENFSGEVFKDLEALELDLKDLPMEDILEGILTKKPSLDKDRLDRSFNELIRDALNKGSITEDIFEKFTIDTSSKEGLESLELAGVNDNSELEDLGEKDEVFNYYFNNIENNKNKITSLTDFKDLENFKDFNIDRLGDEIYQNINFMEELDVESNKIKIDLYPKKLGSVEVELKLKDGKLDAKILVENKKVEELFTSNIDRLNQRISKHNLVLSNIEVETGSGFEFFQENKERDFRGPKPKKENLKNIDLDTDVLEVETMTSKGPSTEDYISPKGLDILA